MYLKSNTIQFVLILSVICLTTVTSAQDTAFTYQGELKQGGNLANGQYNMEFLLWDSVTLGTQIDTTITQNGVEVVDGKFTVELDFGAESFNNGGRWLEVVVNGFTLAPRNPITRSPYSLQTRGIFVDETKRVGIGTTNPAARLDVISDTANTGNNTARFSAPSLGSNTSHIHYGLSGNWFIRSASSFGDVVIQDTGGLVGIGTSNPSNDARLTLTASAGDKALFALSTGDFMPTIHALNIGWGEAIWAQGISDFSPALLAENGGIGPALLAVGGADSEPGSGGVIVIGDDSGANLSLDRNEIMARNNGSTSTLYLNADGGNIKMGAQQTHPAYAYGRVDSTGTLLAGSNNVTAINRLGVGWYEITIAGGVQPTDIFMASANILGHYATIGFWEGELTVICWEHIDVERSNGEFSFVVYRH